MRRQGERVRDRTTATATVALAAVVLAGAGLQVLAAERSPDRSATVAARPTSTLPVFLAAPDAPDPDPPADRGSSDEPAEDLSPERLAFEARYPDQAAATRDPTDPAGDRWALLVGINEHLGPVADNTASAEDADRLQAVLVREGWDPDRIVTMTDTDATGAMIREGLDWLARSSGPDATVVFHYSGHSKKWYGDGGAIVDQALWPTDDDFVHRDDLAAALDEVEHAALWGNMATCEAAGFDVGALTGDGRVWTFSSAADEKSYEDPDHGHSVWGRFLLDRGLWRSPDAVPSVQDAYAVAAPHATTYTSLQEPHGPQTPVLVDDLGAPFELTVPGPVAVPERLTPVVYDLVG